MRPFSSWEPWINDLARDGFGHWLAGFVDGEGCFCLHGKGKTSIQPFFRLKLRDDDAAIIVMMKNRTGLGRLHRWIKHKSKPQIEWIVHKKLECQALAALLTKFPLRAKKKRDFEIWKQAVILHAEVKHIHGGIGGSVPHPNQKFLLKLKLKLQSIRRYPA